MQPSKELAPPMHRCRQQRTPVVQRGKQPPPRSKAPAPAPNRCHRRRLLGQTQVGVLSRRRRHRAAVDVELAPVQAGRPVRAAPWTSMPRRRSRRGLPGQECSRRTARGSFGSSVQPSHGLTQPPHRGRQQCEPVVRRGKQPPPLSRPNAPASAPAPCRRRRQLLSQTKAGVWSTPVAGIDVRRAKRLTPLLNSSQLRASSTPRTRPSGQQLLLHRSWATVSAEPKD